MDIVSALILAIIEGITEFLPISSTGHLVLASKALNIPQTEFLKSFEIIIQLGAIAAIALLYFKRLLTDRKTLTMVVIAFIPTGFLGVIFYSMIKNYLLGNELVTLLSLAIGGIMMIALEWYFKNHQDFLSKETQELSIPTALGIGLFQSISMIPGVSRAAATIFGGMIMGLKREAAVEFSFLLAIPTMLAASGLDLVKNYDTLLSSTYLLPLAIGFIGSFVVALFTVKWLLTFIKTHNFVPFGVYRIVFALLYFIFIYQAFTS